MDKLHFKAEVRKQLTIRNWSYKDLAEHTTYKSGSIRTMLSNEDKLSDKAMKDIAQALSIELD